MIELWDCVKGFTKEEAWGNPDKMNGALVILLDNIRTLYRRLYDDGAIFVIHTGFATSGHSPHSQHYVGNAVDFHIKTKRSYLSQIDDMLNILNILQVSDRVGLGIYPTWNNKGFHLDLRGKRARWGFIGKTQVSFRNAVEYCYTWEAKNERV